jgi:hypothetical protein
VQQQTSLPNDGLQGESELVKAEPEISPTLAAGAEQVERLEADLGAPLIKGTCYTSTKFAASSRGTTTSPGWR